MKMSCEEFLKEFCNILQVESIDINEKLSDIPEWDSLAMIATMAFFDKQFGLKIKMESFKSLDTVDDLYLKFCKD